jgi:adenylate kinase family enzyme
MSNFFVLHGPPGAGKGTMAQFFANEGYSVIGAGDELRNYVATADDLDPVKVSIQTELDQGKLVKTSDLLHVIESKILSLLGESVLGDGIIRASDQAKWLVEFVTQFELPVKFVHLHTDYEVIENRLLNRYFVPGQTKPFPSYDAALKMCANDQKPFQRSDDCIEQMKQRYLDYQLNLEPILEVLHSSSDLVTVKRVVSEGEPNKIYQDAIS